MITYTSNRVADRTANHSAGVLTVFQGLEILGTVEVPDNAPAGQVFDMMDGFNTQAPAAEVVRVQEVGLPDWFVSLLEQERKLSDVDGFERSAYRGYIAYSLSMTDGHYAPEPFGIWVEDFRIDPVNGIYRQNDARHDLAPYLRNYVSQV